MKISIYNIKDEPIGRGGMGQVYLGADPQGNTVAIKEMLAQYVTDPGLRQRFHQEVNILSQLEHPSIVKMYASFEENGNLYLVMEYIEGENLEQYMKRRGAIPENEAVHLFVDILSALEYAHTKGFVHRDIKPGNIMIRPNGKICLLDFGIAKDMNRIGSGLTTFVGTQIGTVGYMSPEQVEGLSIDHRTDIYSLGCVLFYMLTGHHAITEQSNHFKTQMSIVQGKFPSAKLYNPALSDNIHRILYKATDKDMTKRFQSCNEFEAELRKLITSVPTVVYPAVKTGWRKNTIIGAFAGVCAIIVLTIWLFLPNIQYGLGEKNYKKEQYTDAVQYFRKAAGRGNAAAKNKLGVCYSKGNGTIKDIEQAVFWWRNAAEQGNAEAKYNLGECYYSGNGVAKDYEKAVYWFHDAAEQEYANAQFWIGRCYDLGEGVEKNEEEALKWYRKAAGQKHARAHYNIGLLYETGSNADKDEAKHWYKKAVELYSKEAEQGDAEAQFRLGRCYYNGDGVDQDYSEAVKWYRKAAEQGDAPAQESLGGCYYRGNGVDQDYSEAVKWYRKATEQGYANAQFMLGICYHLGYGLTEDYTQAAEWYRKAAEQGYANAQYMLGVCYDNGVGVIKDAIQAVSWYRKAAEQGDASAQYELGLSYKAGYGVTKNLEQAVNWIQKAAVQGNIDAQFALGTFYDSGDGVTKDETQAANWYYKAADQGHTRAQFNIGCCYYNGQGVEMDKNTALYWFERTIKNEDGNLPDQLKNYANYNIKDLKKQGYSSSRAKL